LVKARKTVYPPVSCSTVFRVVFLHLSFLSLHNRFSRISLSKTCAIKDHRILSKRCFSFSIKPNLWFSSETCLLEFYSSGSCIRFILFSY
jgi:hypothetical protein